MHNLLKRQLKRSFGDQQGSEGGWDRFVQAVGEAYDEFDFDRRMLERSLELSSQELLNANSEMRAVFQAIPDVLFRLDRDGTILDLKVGTGSDLVLPAKELYGKRIQSVSNKKIGKLFDEAIARVAEERCIARFEYMLTVQGTESAYEARLAPLLDDQVVAIIQNITERKQAEIELEKTRKELLAAYQQAGMMAEIATTVLHNVGNVLNSANISAGIVTEKVRSSKVAGFGKIARMIREHEADLPKYLAEDPQGRQVGGYLAKLGGHLMEEQREMLAELESLSKNIGHIREIIAVQQGCAKVSGGVESIPAAELIEDAMQLGKNSLDRQRIEVVREYAESRPVAVQKHKALQILVNLLHNALHALEGSGRDDKRLTLSVVDGGAGSIAITVAENGVGIPAENMTRIFEHGFTTRKNGHGFGLHGAALAARELGGALSVYSAGVGRGAAFTLELPAMATAATTTTALKNGTHS